jgi:hypothetical protein
MKNLLLNAHQRVKFYELLQELKGNLMSEIDYIQMLSYLSHDAYLFY